MSMKFEFNEDAFRQVIESGMTKMAADRTRELDRFHAEYAGRPVEEIRPALEQLFARVEWDMGDEQLSAFAAAIHEGRRVEFQAGPIDWSR